MCRHLVALNYAGQGIVSSSHIGIPVSMPAWLSKLTKARVTSFYFGFSFCRLSHSHEDTIVGEDEEDISLVYLI